MSEIVNFSLSTGIVLDEMKIAKAVPLCTSSDNNIYKNYRPLSILPSLSKITEKIVYNRLIILMNVLSTNQYGFRQMHSTSTFFILTPRTGSSKYGTTPKNTQRY